HVSAESVWPVAVALVAFGIVWQLVVAIGGLPAFILPGPIEVAERFARAWTDGTIWPHFWTTVSEVVLGFVVGSAVGLVTGYGLARIRLLARVASPYLVAAQAVPILAIAPLLSLWFGTGLLAKVVVCGLIVFFPVAVATMIGIREVDPGL